MLTIATTSLIMLINASRKPNLPLRSDVYLTKLAETRCTQMKTFSHDDYYNIYSKIIEKKYKETGEILAKDFLTATSTVQAWKASPSHKEIMTAKRYQKIGCANCKGISVCLFGGK